MENKLKELTERLYGEGLEKGRVEADRLVAEAKEKAAAILAEANAEAEKIVKKAEAKAADTEKNSMTEIQLAGRQAVAKIKSAIWLALSSQSHQARLLRLLLLMQSSLRRCFWRLPRIGVAMPSRYRSKRCFLLLSKRSLQRCSRLRLRSYLQQALR